MNITKTIFWSLIFPLGVMLFSSCTNSKSDEIKPKPNVLFIAVDDMNDWVGALGNTQVKTPHIDRLAKMGLIFTNAHCAAPVCNPSRAAVMSGLNPSTTGVYENYTALRDAMPDVVTLTQYFSQNGYKTYGGGKIYHDPPPFNHDPKSFDEYYWWNEDGPKGAFDGKRWRSPYSVLPDPEIPGRPINKITPLTKRNFDWGSVDQPVTDWPDYMVTDWATKVLKMEHNNPYFLAVGIFRPHVPWFNPTEYFNLYDTSQIVLPPVKKDDLDDLGEWARNRAMDGASQHDKVQEFNEWKLAVQAYLASISFADVMVGRLLDALEKRKDRDNTIVVFWSDHGYHLGEKQHWHKRTLWERATHVPLVVVAPGVTKKATRSSKPVGLIDLYPTLVDLCRLPAKDNLDGRSLVPLLKKPSEPWPYPVITTFKPENHAARNENWRYIRYANGEEELYNHQNDPNEWHNLAALPEYGKIKEELRKAFPKEEVVMAKAKR